MEVRTLRDQLFQSEDDELGLRRCRQLARQICDVVRDPAMHPSVPTRAARAVVDGRVDPAELVELLDVIGAMHARRAFKKSPGAYFVTSIKRIFQRNEVPW